MIAELGLGIAGLCTIGGAYFAGRRAGDFRLNGRRILIIPLNSETGDEATVLMPWHMDPESWDVLLVTLNAMEPGLVQHSVDERPVPPRDPLAKIREHEAAVMEEARSQPAPRVHPFGRQRNG